MPERTALVTDVQRPVQMLFHRQLGSAKPIFNLIAFAPMNQGTICVEVPFGFQTQNRVQALSGSQPTMQIGRLRCHHPEPLVIAGQINLQQGIGLFQCADLI